MDGKIIFYIQTLASIMLLFYLFTQWILDINLILVSILAKTFKIKIDLTSMPSKYYASQSQLVRDLYQNSYFDLLLQKSFNMSIPVFLS